MKQSNRLHRRMSRWDWGLGLLLAMLVLPGVSRHADRFAAEAGEVSGAESPAESTGSPAETAPEPLWYRAPELSPRVPSGEKPTQAKPGLGVFIMDRDGSNLEEFAFTEISNGSPSWSPDGTAIVFNTSGGSTARLVLRGVSGPLTGAVRDLGWGGAACWSPDGKQLAYFVRGGNPADAQPGVWIMKADATDRKWLSPGEWPRWSPDGKKLVFASNHEGFPSLYTFELADGTCTRLVEQKYGRVMGGTWSPDSKRVVFIGKTDTAWNSAGELVIADVTQSPVSMRVRYSGSIGWIPSWSPDGKAIAFWIADPSGATLIHTISPDGDESPLLLKNQRGVRTNTDPAWSPDSRRIVFIRTHPPVPRVGDLAPDFTVETADGTKFSLQQERGKFVLLHFWAAHRFPSPGELSVLQGLQENFQTERQFTILGLCMGARPEVLRMAKEQGMSWTQASAPGPDEEGVARDYAAPKDGGLILLIGTDGKILIQRTASGVLEMDPTVKASLK